MFKATAIACTEEFLRQCRRGAYGYLTCLGFIRGDEKKEIFTQSDIFLLPTYREGFPNSLIEAMSHGIPVVTTNVGSIPEIVSDKTDGFLVEPGHIDEIAKSLETLIRDSHLRKAMGEKAREKVKKNFSTGILEKQLENVWRSALGQHYETAYSKL